MKKQAIFFLILILLIITALVIDLSLVEDLFSSFLKKFLSVLIMSIGLVFLKDNSIKFSKERYTPFIAFFMGLLFVIVDYFCFNVSVFLLYKFLGLLLGLIISIIILKFIK